MQRGRIRHRREQPGRLRCRKYGEKKKDLGVILIKEELVMIKEGRGGIIKE